MRPNFAMVLGLCCTTPSTERQPSRVRSAAWFATKLSTWSLALATTLSRINLMYFHVLTIFCTPKLTMLVPEHLTTIVDSLDSWSSRSFRELYESMRPRTPDAIGLAFTPINLIASWIDTAGSLQILKQPVNSEYRQLYESIVEGFIYEDDYYYSRFSNDDEGDLMTMFELNFSPITSALAERLGHEPTYTALFLPTVFGALGLVKPTWPWACRGDSGMAKILLGGDLEDHPSTPNPCLFMSCKLSMNNIIFLP
jgi:hypothetical protein